MKSDLVAGKLKLNAGRDLNNITEEEGEDEELELE